jgi:hypothetical protein
VQAVSVGGCTYRGDATMQKMMMGVTEFCAAHGIGRSLFYKLVENGRGPKLARVGRRTLISAEAAAEWRKRMEADGSTAGARQ